MREGDEVDVWFTFGVFHYGFEGRVVKCDFPRTIEIEPSSHELSERDELNEFLFEIAKNPKGLIRCEIRKFLDQYVIKTLYSQYAPKITSTQSLHIIFFELMEQIPLKREDEP